MKTSIRKFDEAVASGSADAAQVALKETTKVIARTARKGTIHKKNASRKISRLTKRVKAMESAA